MLRLHTFPGLVLAISIAATASAGHEPGSRPDRQPGSWPAAEAVRLMVASNERASHPYGTRIADYPRARSLLWDKVYADGGETLYCAQRFGARKGKNINIEHVFPMSWVAWHLRCGERKECRRSSEQFNRIEADLHNLWPALKSVNKARGSHPFAIIKGEKNLLRGCDFEVDERRRVVEPAKQSRGEIARSMFYMANEYGLKIRARQGATLKRWHRDDPVSATERWRNDLIETIQGNRNPYIDDPRQVDRLRF